MLAYLQSCFINYRNMVTARQLKPHTTKEQLSSAAACTRRAPRNVSGSRIAKYRFGIVRDYWTFFYFLLHFCLLHFLRVSVFSMEMNGCNNCEFLSSAFFILFFQHTLQLVYNNSISNNIPNLPLLITIAIYIPI